MARFSVIGGRYVPVRLLGEGGAARVWLVFDRDQDDRPLALKELTDPDEERISAFRAEFAALAGLRHPNLAEVRDFDHHAGSPYFTLEYVDGDDLVSTARREGPPSLLDLTAEALRALSFLHDFGIVHRDLKPGNLLVRREARLGARLVVLDFGLALDTRNGERGSVPAGTLPYLAPELFAGASAGPASDLYGLAAVVHEAVLGAPPATLADGEDLAGFVRRLGRPLRELDWPQAYPRGLRDWLFETLAPDPGARPAGASEALARLNALCQTEHSVETRITRASRLASGAPPGRERELDRLAAWVDDVAGPRLIVLTGDVGSGKTRILRWIAARAIRRGRTVRSRLPAVPSSPEPQDESTLVILDDPQTIGRQAVDFVCRVGRGLEDQDLRVVTAIDPLELDEPELTRLLRDVELLPAVKRLDLPPLDRQGVGSVVTRLFPGEGADGPRTTWLAESSAGSPAALESLLVDEAWENRGVRRTPATLEASVSRRLDLAGRETRRWLETLAVFGRDSPRVHVAAASGLSPAAGEAAAAEATLLGLATDELGLVSPSSAAVSDIVRSSMPPDDRRALHRRVAEILEQETTDRGGVRRLARIWLGAGDLERSLQFAMRAAEIDRESGHHADAARWLRFAVARLPRRDPRCKKALLEFAKASSASGQHLEAYRALAKALRRTTDPLERAESRAEQAFELSRAGRGQRAIVVAEDAIRSAESLGARSVVARAQKAKAAVLVRLQRNEEALSLALAAAGEFERTDDVAQRAESLHLAAIGCSNLRRIEEGRAYFGQAIRLARATEDHTREVRALVGLAVLERRAARIAVCIEHVLEARRLATSLGMNSDMSFILCTLAAGLQEIGRFDESIRVGNETISTCRNMGDRVWLNTAMLQNANALIHVGRPAEAAEEVRRLLPALSKWADPRARGYAMVTLAEALIESPSADPGKIDDLIGQARALATDDRKLMFATHLLELERHELTGANTPPDAAWAAFQLERERHPEALEPPLRVRCETAYAEALLGAAKTQDARELAEAAAVYAEAEDLPAYAARTHALVAETLRRQGDSAAASRSQAKARARLEEAAGRIDDGEMRQGFLDRPVFRRVRRPASEASIAGDGRLVAIYDMIRVLNSESDPDVLLETMMDMALDVVQAERGLILLRDETAGEFTVRLARNLEKETIEDAAEFSRNVVLRAGKGQAVLAVDTEADERFRDLRSVSVFGIRSVICVPLRLREKIVGAVYMANRREGSLFTPDDLRFLEAFADHAALALENARIRRELERENMRLQVAADERVCFDNLIGRSKPMQKVYELIPKVASTDLPVLIQGESGTGKELVARAVNAHSLRKRKVFLSENCAAIPEALLESELFGHVRGAFTGAERDRPGLFEQAHLGTLFLDEIGDMPASMQARLLRVLQEGELRRVGGERTIRVDVRVIAATNRDLSQEVKAGRFREDLYYRLQVLLIHLPPLRERGGDIPLLVDHFLRRISAERGRPVPRMRTAVLSLLEAYSWPGNVRQLENQIQRMVLLAGDGPIDRAVVESDRGLRETLLGTSQPAVPALSLQQGQRDRIRQALVETKGNRTRAAKLLGISRATIFRKIKEYGLEGEGA